MRILKQYLNDKSSKGWKLCYRGSDDGFTATSFHAKCNNVGEVRIQYFKLIFVDCCGNSIYQW